MAPRKAAPAKTAAKAAAKKAAPLGTTSPEAMASGNPAAALFAAAAAAGGANPAAMRAQAGPANGSQQFSSQIPRAQTQRVEIRIDGRIKYANAVYEPDITVTDDQIILTADLNPTWIDPKPKQQLAPPTRFDYNGGEDARNGEEVIQRVHTGRRDIYEGQE